MSMKQMIEVETRNKYGTSYYYPLNKEAKNAMELFNNRKSLSAANIAALKKMGFIIKQFVKAGEKLVDAGEL